MLYVKILEILLDLLILTYCAAHICTRSADEIKHKFESNKRITTNPEWGYEDTYFMPLLEGSSVFVDKTMLIKKILDTDSKIILITSPPKTGKSINLNMLKAFFELRTRKLNGTIYPAQQTSTYKFFTTGYLNTADDSPLQTSLSIWPSMEMEELTMKAAYTNAPLISKYKSLIDQHLAQYPVIHYEFFSLFSKELNLTHSLRKQICDPFVKHKFPYYTVLSILESNHTTDEQKRTAITQLSNFSYYDNCCSFNRPLSTYELENSGLFLSEMMYTLLGKPVVILVDEYVTLLAEHLFEKDQRPPGQPADEEFQSGVQLMKNFLTKTFVQNPYLKKAVLTGSVPITKNRLFQNITDFVHYNVLNNELQEFYGLTEKELESLFEHFDIGPDLATGARQFYNGYVNKRHTNLTIYNVWSIVNLLNEKQIAKYWVEHRETLNKLALWVDINELEYILKPLINGSHATVTFTDADLSTKDALLANKSNYTKNDVDRVLSLLWEMGFLTYSDHGSNGDNIRVRLPNEEIRKKMLEVLEN